VGVSGYRNRPFCRQGSIFIGHQGPGRSIEIEQSFENSCFPVLMIVEVESGIVGAVEESRQNKQGTAAQQRAFRPGIVEPELRRGVGALPTKILPQSPRLTEQRKNEQRAAGIGQYAGPSNHRKGTVGQSYVV